jgi:heparan-alpha-glucosaminide N-acetyltransferase
MSATAPDSPASAPPRANRVTSIDALRGLVMFLMILVNDIAGGQDIPAWIRHYNDGRAGSGMTFVDLVFPAFLFIVGMSIPFALGARLARRDPVWKILGHVLLRTVALLAIGIMMVNTESGPPNGRTPLSRNAWAALLFFAAILSFCSLTPRRAAAAADVSRKRRLAILSLVLRAIGIATLLWLALIFRTDRGHPLLAFHAAWPFIRIRTEWYGILGLIGWAYLVGSIAYLCFRTHRLPLLTCIALLLCLFAADQQGAFNDLALNDIVNIGTALGSQPSITLAGMLLATILLTPDTAGHARRIRFTALYILGFAAAALLAEPLYGTIKNEATPSWCLWACAVTAAVWLLFYFITDVLRAPWLLKPLTIAGENVLLAYLLSQGLEYWLTLMRLGDAYENLATNFPAALARSTGCAVIILIITALLNRAGFRLKL